MKKYAWLPFLFLLLIASGTLFSCSYLADSSSPQADSLNLVAYQLHYKNLVASNRAASQALKAAGKSGVQKAEAYNNLAFCAFMKMDFERSERLLKQVYEETTSELECLIADVGMMKICQRTAINKEFYDYRNSAMRRLKRIHDDYASLTTPQELARLHYGESEFYLTTAIYHYYLQQEQQAIESLNKPLLNSTLVADTAQQLSAYYLAGLGLLERDSYEERIVEKFNYLVQLLRTSHDQGYLYFEGNASQALSELFQNDRSFAVLGERRPHLLRLINPKDLPQDSLILTFAQRSLNLFSRYGDYYQLSGAYRTLSACYTKRGEYELALAHLTKALSYVNLHHETYYHCTDTTDRLQTYVPMDSVSLELKWITQERVKTIPEWIARLREQLSMTYAAMGRKPESDYNRNIYLDILDYTRQDKELLSRYNALEKESQQLTIWLSLVIGGGVLLLILLAWLNRLWRVRNQLYIENLNKTLSICKKITASVPLQATELEEVVQSIEQEVGEELLQLLQVDRMEIRLPITALSDEATHAIGTPASATPTSGTPVAAAVTVFSLYTPDNSSVVGELHLYATQKLKREARALVKIITPYLAWTLEHGVAMIQLSDERIRIEKEQYVGEQRLAQHKRQNVVKRACLFLVTGITPYMDRIINEVHKLVRYDYLSDQTVRREKFQYVNELVGCINEYNEMLTRWIQMRQGSLSLSIELFEVQTLFELLEKGKKTYEMKQQRLEVLPTTALVKADKALTLFMLNTLADNARKYTQAGGTIRITATEYPEYVELAVQDDGPGLSATDVAAILSEKVYDSTLIGLGEATDKEQLRKQKGGGFGLMNCKGIIEKYRKTNPLFQVCTFSLTSELGKGSRFSFRLPKGVKRAWGWFFLLLSFNTACQGVELLDSEGDKGGRPTVVATSMAASVVAEDSLLLAANGYAQQVYDANVAGNYHEALNYADSALQALNLYRLQPLDLNKQPKPPTAVATPLLALVGDGRAAELIWLAQQFDTDYYTLLDVRNEAAVAFLALGELDAYRYNNNAYTTLYKQLSEDVSLEEYCLKMQVSSTNKSVAIVLCFLLLFLLLVGYYVLYLRKQFFHQFSLEQVLQINKRAFEALQTTRQGVDEVAQQLVTQLFQEVNELVPIEQLAIAICHGPQEQLHYAFSTHPGSNASSASNLGGLLSHGSLSTDSLQEFMARSFVNRTTLWSEQSCFKALPLWIERGVQKHCIGVLALTLSSGWKQEDDRIMMELVAGYVAVLVHTNLVLMEQKYLDIESAHDEARRIQREEHQIHVQNLVLDNCLSTIKHETVYYPNKVKQLIEKLDCEEWEVAQLEQVETIGELMDYYKGVFTLLAACAARQLDEVTFRRSVVDSRELAAYAQRYFARVTKRQSRKLTLGVEVDELSLMGDLTQLKLLLECLINEAVAAPQEGELALNLYQAGDFIRVDFTDYRRTYTQEELNGLFFPQLARMKQEVNGMLSGTEFLISKQIIREHDEFAGRRGCRINAEAASSGVGYTIWFTIPSKKNRN
ncbi:MAG: DUF5113 domain-containing protein [Phocaeicola sp.]